MNFFSNNSLLARQKDSISKLSGLTLWLDASDGATIVFNGTTVSQWKDKSGNNRDALQATSTAQPTTASSPSRVVFNKSTQKLVANMPTVSGTMFLATPNGTQVYGVKIPTGNYDIGARGGLYMPDNAVIGQIVCQGNLSTADKDATIAWLKSKGGGSDYGTVTNFANFWRNWSEITSFPLINTSKGTNLGSAWYGCTGLTSFPLLDTGAATSLQTAWGNCSGLLDFPAINTSNVSNFSGTWTGCSGLTSFPAIDTSKGTVFHSAWNTCSGLTSFPIVNTGLGTDFSNAWSTCAGLSSFPLLNVANGIDFSYAWYFCKSLTSFPLLNTSNGTTFKYAWYNCSGLGSFPALNVAKSTDFSSAWSGCSNLVTFPDNFFNNCLATNFTNAFTSTKLSQSSIDNILVSINSNGTSNGTFNQTGGSAPSSTGQSAITAMRSRGWTVTVTGGF